jgi:hypothetical protein
MARVSRTQVKEEVDKLKNKVNRPTKMQVKVNKNKKFLLNKRHREKEHDLNLK